MSFDLGIWDAVRPPRVAEAEARYEQLRTGEDPIAASSERVSAFLDECGRRWPHGDAGEAVPFASHRTPSAVLLEVRDEAATELFGEWAEMAERHGLVLYDPQSGVVSIPSRLSFDAQPPAMNRGWFGRKRV